MKTINIIIAVAAFALATGNVKAQDFQQRFETGLADDAKLEWDFRQLVESKWAGSTVLVTPWHLFISAGFDEHYSASPKVLKLWARIWALQGLLTFKDSVYYESNITDSHGKYEAHVDRRDYADELAIDAEQNKLHAQITSKPSR